MDLLRWKDLEERVLDSEVGDSCLREKMEHSGGGGEEELEKEERGETERLQRNPT